MAGKINKKTNIGVFGYGHMGQAILKLLQKQPELKNRLNFFVYSLGVKKIAGAACLNSFEELINKSDYIFICLKPQEFYNLKPLTINPGNKIFISLMAGVKISNIKKIINSRNIVRLMPNLPLQAGQGVIAWFADEKQFAKKRLTFIKTLFSTFGLNFNVKQESDLDKITALTGSGPAYVFLFMDALIQAGISLGFSQAQAEQMVLQLITGSLEYYKGQKNKYSLGELIKLVKSKKGTTEAALDKLNADKFYKEWQAAIYEAYKRAKAISQYDFK